MPATGLKCRGWIAGNVSLWFAKIHRASRRLTVGFDARHDCATLAMIFVLLRAVALACDQ
jgi:hypothetical protein